MNFSFLTSLDAAILAVLAVSAIATITVTFLVVFVLKKLFTVADLNRNATVRFSATRIGNDIYIEENKCITLFGIISFVNGKSNEEMRNIKVGIVINGISAAVTTDTNAKKVNGTLNFFNNTDADLIVTNLTFLPKTTDTLINTMFDHNLLAKGEHYRL